MSERSSNRWKLSVISDFRLSAWVVERLIPTVTVERSGPLRRVGQTEKGLLKKAAATGMDLAQLATSR
jgi:hypothetical protein